MQMNKTKCRNRTPICQKAGKERLEAANAIGYINI
jgi:hypothetical protein